jgi:hypothetical protein
MTKNNIRWRSYDILVHMRSLPLVPVVPTRHITTCLYKIVINRTGFQMTVYLNGVSYTRNYKQNECEYHMEYSVVL